MSITLCYVCKMEAGRGPVYWWPLLCEVLQDHNFHFGDPKLPGTVSDYFYHRYLPPYEGEKEEHEPSVGSFRALWDEVYRQVGGVTVPFWWKDKDFSIEILLTTFPTSEKGTLQVGIDFTLIGGQIYNSTREEARAMIRRVLFCFKDLYELCCPVSADIHWEDNERNYAPWALFGETPPDRDTQRGPSRPPGDVHPPENYLLIKEPLSNGKFLFLFDPIPVPSLRSWKENPLMMGWEFLSLFEQGEGWIDVV